jgi:hypothetical protein
MNGGIIGAAMGYIVAHKAPHLGFSSSKSKSLLLYCIASGADLATITGACSGSTCVLENLRGTSDVKNAFYGGLLGGVIGHFPEYMTTTNASHYRNNHLLAIAGIGCALLCSGAHMIGGGSCDPAPVGLQPSSGSGKPAERWAQKTEAMTAQLDK